MTTPDAYPLDRRQARGYAARVLDVMADVLAAKLSLDLRDRHLADVAALLRGAAEAAVRISEDLEEVDARDR